MQQYDVTMKSLLHDFATKAIPHLTGATVVAWRNVELPQARNPRVDLLGETDDGRLLHVESEVRNSPDLPWRMLGYRVRTHELEGRDTVQMVFYIGEAPLTMERGLALPGLVYSFELIDVKLLDGRPLLGSSDVRDNIISVLLRLPDERAAARQIVSRIADLEPGATADALWQLVTLAGLRRKMLEHVLEEVRKVDTLYDIMEHPLFGSLIRKGREEGREEGVRAEAVRLALRLGLPLRFCARGSEDHARAHDHGKAGRGMRALGSCGKAGRPDSLNPEAGAVSYSRD